jgi:RNA-binding protein
MRESILVMSTHQGKGIGENKMTKLGDEKAKAIVESPSVWIGKSGITRSVVEEIKRQLKRKDVVKVKLLKPFVKAEGKKEAAEKLAKMTNSRVVQKVGFVVVLSKKKQEKV